MDLDLFNAAAEGNIDYLSEHVDDTATQVTPMGNTALHIYITAKSKMIDASNPSENINPSTPVEAILQMCPSLLTKSNIKGETPIHFAARHGNDDILKALIRHAKTHPEDLENGIGGFTQMLRMTNKEKDTALHEAASNNYPKVVRILTKEDLDFQYGPNDAGETPFYLAAERGYDGVVKEIFDNSHSPNFRGPLGRTALHAAVIHDRRNITTKILQEITKTQNNEAAILIKQADEQGWTALHYAAHFGHVNMVRLLLTYDRSVAYEANNDDMLTALHVAARRGKKIVIEELLNICPDCCEQVDSRGWNVLHFAGERGDHIAINSILNKSLLSRNLINEKDEQGDTIFHRFAAASLAGKVVYLPKIYPRICKMVFNKKNETALDVMLVHAKLTRTTDVDDLTVYSQKASARQFHSYAIYQGRRILHEETIWKDEWNNDDSNFKKASAAQLVVAALVATVTFAAGFTLPGGYKGNEGPDQGSAILKKKAAFKAFVITDTMALVLSVAAVFHFMFLLLQKNHSSVLYLTVIALFLTTASTGLMVVAFVTGMYAVLEHSSVLAIATCVLGFLFFIMNGFYALRGVIYFIPHRWKVYEFFLFFSSKVRL